MAVADVVDDGAVTSVQGISISRSILNVVCILAGVSNLRAIRTLVLLLIRATMLFIDSTVLILARGKSHTSDPSISLIVIPPVETSQEHRFAFCNHVFCSGEYRKNVQAEEAFAMVGACSFRQSSVRYGFDCVGGTTNLNMSMDSRPVGWSGVFSNVFHGRVESSRSVRDAPHVNIISSSNISWLGRRQDFFDEIHAIKQ